MKTLNLKTAEEIHTKLSNFGHHNEFDVSGVTVEDIQLCIDNRRLTGLGLCLGKSLKNLTRL